MNQWRFITILLSTLGAFPLDARACLLSETLEKALFKLPQLRNNHASLMKSKGERSLKGWRDLLSESERNAAIESAVKHDLAQSRTATLGKSSKHFQLSESEVKAQAEKNILEALNLVKTRAKNPFRSPDEVYDFLRQINSSINKNLIAIYEKGGEITAGSFRRFARNQSKTQALMSPEQLAHQFETDLRAFSQELFERLQKEPDPSELASWSYLRLAQDLKPFGDGNGRTGLMLAQYCYLSRGFPPLTISQVGHVIDSVGMKHVGGVMDEAILAYRKTGNSSLLKSVFDESSKETIRLALRKKAIPQSMTEKKIRDAGFRLNDGKVIGAGNNGTVSKFVLEGQSEAIGLKWARTYGDLANIRAEAELARFFQHEPSIAQKHFPRLVKADPTGYWMAKEFIEGKTALELLQNHHVFTSVQKQELQQLFLTTQKIEREHQVYLDLLPKNIVWSEKRKTWVLIDLGPAYYPAPEIQGTFEEWFKMIWKADRKQPL